MSLEHIRKTYGVPAKRGMRVSIQGRAGVIIGARDQYLRIKLEGSAVTWNYHPTAEIEYKLEKKERKP